VRHTQMIYPGPHDLVSQRLAPLMMQHRSALPLWPPPCHLAMDAMMIGFLRMCFWKMLVLYCGVGLISNMPAPSIDIRPFLSCENWHVWTKENIFDPHDCPIGRKRHIEQVYESRTMNVAGLTLWRSITVSLAWAEKRASYQVPS